MGAVPTARKSCNTRVSGAEKREQEAKEERRSARRRARITTWYTSRAFGHTKKSTLDESKFDSHDP
jgi:hypothetical protein